MDDLKDYLSCATYYDIDELHKILDKKKTITSEHIANIKPNHPYINFVQLFENYGYIFTNDDYIELVSTDGYYLSFIQNKTYELCEIAVNNNSYALKFVPDNQKTIELCEIALKYNDYVDRYIPTNIYKLLNKSSYLTEMRECILFAISFLIIISMFIFSETSAKNGFY